MRGERKLSPLFAIAFVFVRLDHIASLMVNTNDGIMRRAVMLPVADCVLTAFGSPHHRLTEWRTLEIIAAAFVFARAGFGNVDRLMASALGY